ncbi:uncharacterized protein TrAFT101_001167 [Trichoderma asperellum]|uniref:uncharacterized protein n=1 Tax=Trichoderma asperellum TaxID=101201 RepID=UPI00332FBEEB|nr:hypothetical protein TrAFT101_001167 [Trichoderma asperellum]
MRISAAVDQTSHQSPAQNSSSKDPQPGRGAPAATAPGTRALPLAAGPRGREALIQEPSPATPKEDAVIGPCEALLRALF